MLSSGASVIIWDEMLSGDIVMICTTYYVANEGNVIIWCYHVMLSSGMITLLVLFFLQTSLTPLLPRRAVLLMRDSCQMLCANFVRSPTGLTLLFQFMNFCGIMCQHKVKVAIKAEV
jgi:hypothetical protein